MYTTVAESVSCSECLLLPRQRSHRSATSLNPCAPCCSWLQGDPTDGPPQTSHSPPRRKSRHRRADRRVKRRDVCCPMGGQLIGLWLPPPSPRPSPPPRHPWSQAHPPVSSPSQWPQPHPLFVSFRIGLHSSVNVNGFGLHSHSPHMRGERRPSRRGGHGCMIPSVIRRALRQDTQVRRKRFRPRPWQPSSSSDLATLP